MPVYKYGSSKPVPPSRHYYVGHAYWRVCLPIELIIVYFCTVRLYQNTGCVFISFFIDTDGNAKSYGHVSVSSCSSKDELPNGLVIVELSSGSTYYVCLNGFT